MSTYYLTPNNIDPSSNAYTGLAYVFDSSGGFAVDQSFPQINLNTYSPVAQYDVTEAIQIKFSVRTLNEKIGVIKDLSNEAVLKVLFFNVLNETLSHDSVTVSTNDFLNGIKTSNIVSMGKMSSLYRDFNYTVMEYFGAPYGFSSVFANATDFDANNGIFDSTTFINLINGITFDGGTGSVVSDLSGYFTVNDLNKHLRFICGTNVFGNRPPSGNYGLTNGFMAGDLIYIPNGMNITLSVAVEPEPYSPPDNVGPTNLHSVDSIINYSEPQYNIHKVTTSTITNITQSYSVPILIIVDNEDRFNPSDYGKNWVDIGFDSTPPSEGGPVSLGPQQWLSVAISSLGEYQSAVNQQGDIYISKNHGKSWYLINTINPSPVMSIGVSETGQWQTVSDGLSIYTSSDFGLNWNPVIPSTIVNNRFDVSLNYYDINYDVNDEIIIPPTPNVGTSNVFVAVSLCGQYQSIILSNGQEQTVTSIGYQSVLSCGDNLYSSSDFGATWKPLDPTLSQSNRDLFSSIQAFPTGSMAISFTGKYQSIACENIWLSSDYGTSWTIATLPDPNNTGSDFNDRNWDGISVSSDGKIQSATDSGGYIYISHDYGNTWTTADTSATGNKTWQSISISANANYQTAIDIDGDIYLSLDYGSTWQLTNDTNTHGRQWQGIAVSSNGQYQTAIEYGGTIWASNLL